MPVVYKILPHVGGEDLNEFFAGAWPNHTKIDFKPILEQALIYVCAYDGGRLIGFVKIVGDGGIHGFLLDPTVASDRRRQGIGRRMVEVCAEEAKRRGIKWLHVDYEPQLKEFYSACGFLSTHAGLRDLSKEMP